MNRYRCANCGEPITHAPHFQAWLCRMMDRLDRYLERRAAR